MDEGARLVVPYEIEEERRGGWSMGGREDGGSRIRLGEVERIPTRPRSSFTTASWAWRGSGWEVGCAGSASTGGRAQRCPHSRNSPASSFSRSTPKRRPCFTTQSSITPAKLQKIC